VAKGLGRPEDELPRFAWPLQDIVIGGPQEMDILRLSKIS